MTIFGATVGLVWETGHDTIVGFKTSLLHYVAPILLQSGDNQAN